MPEVVIDIDTGRKRRLPAWMLQVSSPAKQRTSQNGDKTCSLLKDQPETQVAGSKSKRILTQDTDGSDKLDLSQRCEAEQGTRKARRRGLGLDKSTLGEAKTKHKKEAAGGERMLDNRDTTKKQKLKSKRPKNSDLQVPSPGREDEVEMTVEDLVTIAEEYVNADREKQHELSITRESHSETRPSSLSASLHVDAGRPIQAAGSGKMLSKCTTTSSSSYSTSTERNKGKSPGVENVATNIARTGDAVQDMLDLFIGPLLKKPSAIEQEYGATKTESMNIPNETGKQARSREVWREEGTLILTKKKSSLKDKAWKLYENGKLINLVDETLDPSGYRPEEVKRVIEIALLCTQSTVAARPTMSEVVILLLSKGVPMLQPTRPTFIDATSRVHGDTYSSTGLSPACNATASITQLSAR